MRITGKKIKAIVAVSVGVLVLVALTLTDLASSGTPQKSSPGVKSASSAGGPTASTTAAQSPKQNPPSKPNSVIYKDPVTGKIIQTPPSGYPGQLAEKMKNTLSTSSAGLVERQSPVSGTYVNLNGRFRSLMAASESAEGDLKIGCQSAGEVNNSKKSATEELPCKSK